MQFLSIPTAYCSKILALVYYNIIGINIIGNMNEIRSVGYYNCVIIFCINGDLPSMANPIYSFNYLFI